MPVTTSQQISRYYDQFRNVEVTFTKEVIKTTLLYTKQVYLKSMGYQWPVIIYSTSLAGAKIIANLQGSLKDALKRSNNIVSLRFSFLRRDKPDPLAFFVGARVTGITPYESGSRQLHFLTLQFTQRPPDDLIFILGSLLEANVNAQRRREERVIVNPDSMKKLGLASRGTIVTISNVPRKCIIRDVSFSGAKVIIHGVPQFIMDKPASLRVAFDDPEEVVDIVGRVIRFETVEGRTDIAAFAIQYESEKVPMTYKLRLNEYLRTVKPAPPNVSEK